MERVSNLPKSSQLERGDVRTQIQAGSNLGNLSVESEILTTIHTVFKLLKKKLTEKRNVWTS